MADDYLTALAEEGERIRADIPKGKFRVILVDEFDAPPECCVYAHASSLGKAIEVAKGFAQPFQRGMVLDDQGECVFLTPRMEEG